MSKYFSKHIFFGDDFKETYDLFEAMVSKDKDIIKLIPENKRKMMKKNGLISFVIKHLITDYVELNKVAFTANRTQPQESTNISTKSTDEITQ